MALQIHQPLDSLYRQWQNRSLPDRQKMLDGEREVKSGECVANVLEFV